MKVCFRSATVVETHKYEYIYIEGEKFRLYDVFSPLDSINADESIAITNKRLARVLVETKVLKWAGSKRALLGAEKGRKFNFLYNKLKERLSRIE